MNDFLKLSALALCLHWTTTKTLAFCPIHPVRYNQILRKTIKLWDFLGEEILEECIGIFHDGLSPDPHCFPSNTSSPTVLVNHQEQPIQNEGENC